MVIGGREIPIDLTKAQMKTDGTCSWAGGGHFIIENLASFGVFLLLLLWITFLYIWLVIIDSFRGNLLKLWLLVPLAPSSSFPTPIKMGIEISRNRKMVYDYGLRFDL